MPRPIDLPDESEFIGDDLEAYDQLPPWRKGDEAGPYWGTILHAPAFALHRQQFSTLIRTAGERTNTYTHRQRELVDQALSAVVKDNHVYPLHVGDAIAAGVAPGTIAAIRGDRWDELDPEDRLLVTYVKEVVTGTVSDATFDAVEQLMGTRGVIEYTVLITVLYMTMRQMQAFKVPQPTDEEVDALVEQYRQGKAEVPDHMERIR